MNQMDKDIKAKWLTALRSGQFEQGTKMLKTNLDRYCCLGVLCVVVGAEFKGGGVILNNKMVSADGTVLSSSFKEQIQLQPDEEDNLISMNDDDHFSFNEIADYIEKSL